MADINNVNYIDFVSFRNMIDGKKTKELRVTSDYWNKNLIGKEIIFTDRINRAKFKVTEIRQYIGGDLYEVIKIALLIEEVDTILPDCTDLYQAILRYLSLYQTDLDKKSVCVFDFKRIYENCAHLECKNNITDIFNFCPKHKCLYYNCDRHKHSKSVYCFEHKCHHNKCDNLIVEGMRLCKDHKCKKKLCNKKSLPGKKNCLEHTTK